MSKLAVNIHRGIIALSLSFSFMFFVYAPLEVFLGNTNEFWFDITHLIPIVGVCFLIFSAFLILLMELLYKFLYPKSKNAKRVFYIIYTIMLMIFVGLYIQGNYIPRDYGVLDGRTINWSLYTSYAIASIVLWVLIAVIGIILWIKWRKQIFKIGQGVSALIFVMLTVALISLGVNAQNIVKKDNLIVTDKGQWTLSENKNIYVLVLDTFDAEYLRVLLEEEGEEYSELLEDFTFYSNAVGGYPYTKPSVALLLTGEWYENTIPYEDYIKENGFLLYEELKKNNYSIGVYTSPAAIAGNTDTYENVYQGSYKISNVVDFVTVLYKLIAFEYMPQQLKSFFTVNTYDFDLLKVLDKNKNIEGEAYLLSDEDYYKAISEKGFELTSENNCFRFVHLWGMHPPYSFGENVVVDGNSYTYKETAQGAMNEVKALIENLKKEGIYDNTAIMILADHGGGELASELNCNPLLLVKGFDEKHEFTISENPISYEDIYPSLLSWASEENQENAVWNIEGERERRFLHFRYADSTSSDYMPLMIEYKIDGNVSDKTATIIKTGRQFFPGGINADSVSGLSVPDMKEQNLLTEEPYKIEVLVDKNNEDFQSMYVSGLGKITENAEGEKYAWTEGGFVYFKLDPEGEQKVDCNFQINFTESDNAEISTHVTASGIYATVNGEAVLINKYTDDSINFVIPKEIMSEDIVDVIVYFPNRADEDKTLAITSIVLEQKVPVKIDNEFTIDFSKNGNFTDMVADGWNGQEESAVWSTAASSISFLSDDDSDLIMQISYGTLVADIPTVIKVNGNDVCTLSQENAGEIIIPKEYLNPSVQQLEIVTEAATSPAELGMSEDSRMLGIYVNRITITDSVE